MKIKVLLLLSEIPGNPTSGAARSMHTICKMLADDPEERFEVSAQAVLEDRSICYRYWSAELITSTEYVHNCEEAYWCDLERNDVVLTYGDDPEESAWRRDAKSLGAKIVFGLRNLSYLNKSPEYFSPSSGVDAVLSCSEFVRQSYLKRGIDSTHIPLPMDLAEVIAPGKNRRSVAFVNPEPDKGLMFAMRVFEGLAVRAPGIPIEVWESRGTGKSLHAAANRLGEDLRMYQLTIHPCTRMPRDIYANSHVVIMPSICEPAGRVAVEAMMNGIPVIAGDSGGLPEIVGAGGIVLPAQRFKRDEARNKIGAWVDCIIKLYNDQDFYEDRSLLASIRGSMFSPSITAPLYREFFANLVSSGKTKMENI